MCESFKIFYRTLVTILLCIALSSAVSLAQIKKEDSVVANTLSFNYETESNKTREGRNFDILRNLNEEKYKEILDSYDSETKSNAACKINLMLERLKYVNLQEESDNILKELSNCAAQKSEQERCPVTILKNPNKTGYVQKPGIGWHKLSLEAKSWNDARKSCREDGAYLAIINSRAEAEYLSEMLKKASKNNDIRNAVNTWGGWVGIHDNFVEGEWISIFGDPLSSTGYDSWTVLAGAGKQPDNNYQGAAENCGMLDMQTGSFDDGVCAAKLAFFCKITDN